MLLTRSVVDENCVHTPPTGALQQRAVKRGTGPIERHAVSSDIRVESVRKQVRKIAESFKMQVCKN